MKNDPRYNPRMLGHLKWRVGRLLERNPHLSYWTYSLLIRCPVFLPHDPSYLGVRRLESNFRAAQQTVGANAPLLLDIGANNGISSRGFLKLLPEWQIHAFEPNSIHAANLRSLKERFKTRFTFTIAAVGKPAAGTGESISLYTPFWGKLALHTLAATSREVAMQTTMEVWGVGEKEIRMVRSDSPLIAIDALNLNPRIVKIDAEGSEAMILQGMSATLARCRPVVLMEVTSDEHGSAAHFLGQLDYQAYMFDPADGAFHTSTASATEHVTGFRNRYFVPRELTHLIQ